MKKKFLWILLLILALAVFLPACGAKSDEAKTDEVKADEVKTDEAKTAAAGDLVFDVSELGDEPRFIDWNQDGTAMQLIALKAGDEVRLAFNTCQACQGSPWAWFEYLDDGTLQCHNCGQVFGLETVGTPAANGCRPITITGFTVENGKVTVPGSFLKENAALFENWKWGEA